MKIYLIGFMGSGKSTYGQELSSELSLEFMDLDKKIEENEGKTISEIFEEKGEKYFREAEHKALLDTEKPDNLVISCGGGTPCFFDQLDWMNQHGITIYLKLDEEKINYRLMQIKKDRPLLRNLKNKEIKEFTRHKLKERGKQYNKAQIVLNPASIKPAYLKELLKKNHRI